ncbi:MAG: ABC transporter ATP-binding protein [Thermoleophilia bacterium]|nr:ABC transporter ATP-binding protein [Thermoleophilia bacterium]
MTDTAVRTVGLGKMYRIGGQREAYRTLRDTLMQAAKRPLERLRHPGAATHASEVLWALRDVDFEVKQGEALGIIGRNGAGKSTLLKILSHITEPTEGRVEITGRVGSLLEVGTGFHGELTGRENIFLNGAILGMTRSEIKRRFDEMVEFSEIGRFLDTPVKRYSSGMYVRLAFAVAAHLDPEILIVDEVLSVGDAAFQKKCLGKMEDVAGHGRTVLFVSHNVQAVRSLCTNAIELQAGRVANTGDAAQVVADYLTRQAERGAHIEWEPGEGPGDREARILAVQVLDESGGIANVAFGDQSIRIRISFELSRVDPRLLVGFELTTGDGTIVLQCYHTDADEQEWPELEVGKNVLECALPGGLLNDGRYLVTPKVLVHGVRWIVRAAEAVSLEVHRVPGSSLYGGLKRSGTIAPLLHWRRAGYDG